MNNFRRLGAMLLPIVIVGTVAATAWASVTIPVHSCTAGISAPVGEEHWTPSDTPEIQLEDGCPAGLEFNPAAFVSPNQVADWRLEGTRTLTMNAISFKLTGFDPGGDLDFGFAVANSGSNVPAEEFPAPGPDGRIRIEFPGGATYAPLFYASCEKPAGCLDADPISLSDFTIELSDDELPGPGGSVEGYPLTSSGLNFWTSENWLANSLGASDYGSGVFTADLELSDDSGSETLWSGIADCRTDGPSTLATAAICPESLAPPEVLDIRSRPDGIYELSMSASDAVGQTAEVTGFEFGVDREAPDAPTGVKATGAFSPSRWTSEFEVGLRWDAPPEQAEGTSPLDKIRWRLLRPGGAVAESGELNTNFTTQQSNVPTEGLWEYEVRFTDAAGNVGDRSYDTFGVDTDAPLPPEFDDLGWVSRDELIEGRSVGWTPGEVPAVLESGVCGYAVNVDNDVFGSPPVRIDESADAIAHRLDPTSPGVHYVHIRSVSCANVGSTVETESLKVDDEGPKITVGGVPASGWSRTPLSLSVGATDGDGAGHAGSGVEAVTYVLDGAPAVTTTGGGLVTVGDGQDHQLTVTAVDAVGNEADPVTFAFSVDSTRPDVAIGARSQVAPQHVAVDVLDSGSGVASVALSYFADGGWRPVGSPVVPAVAGAPSLSAEFEIPDASIPAGTYDFRIVATDVAGNERTVAMPSVRLPLRAEVRVSARVADVELRCRTTTGKSCKSVKACPRGARCKLVPVALADKANQAVIRPYEVDTALVGDAVSVDGQPLAGAVLEAESTEFGSSATVHRSVTTDQSGHFELKLPRGAGRTLTVAWRGDRLRLPASATARLDVRAGIKLSVNSRTARGGTTSRFEGTIRGAAGRIPADGIVVRFEFKTDRGWESFGKKVAVDDRGRFEFSRSWPRSGKRGVVQIRAHVDEAASWPFAEGSSAPIRIRLIP